jgi:hypothetical protein
VWRVFIRLAQGATYIDLNNLNLGEFKSPGDMHVGQNSWLVAKKDTPYEVWNGLLGIEASERSQRPEQAKTVQEVYPRPLPRP